MSLIVILGPTAVGKTKLGVQLAVQLNAEIISADSRQVYRNMDIGTGKDLSDYTLDGSSVPYHLIDIKEAGEAYNVFDFQQDFYKAYQKIVTMGKTAILCGGTGLYLEAALAENQMVEVPTNKKLREELGLLQQEELVKRLQLISGALHNQTDLLERERTIRAIEIEEFKKKSQPIRSPIQQAIVIGLRMEREQLRERIAQRLKARWDEGMVEEVELLLKQGVTHEQLNYYGLEYRFISQFIKGELSFDEMNASLVQAIRRFAKKQMTWYRRMEKKGQYIEWIDALTSNDEKLNRALEIINKKA